MKAETVYKSIRKSQVQRLFVPIIAFALTLSAFFLLNVPALFTNPDGIFLMQVLRLVVLILLAVAFVILLEKLLVWAFPALSAAVRRLSKYGNADAILQDAEKELAAPHLLDQDNMVLTPRFLFKFAGNNSVIVPLESALWVYPLNNMRYSFTEGRERMVYFLRVVTIAGDTFRFASLYKKNIDKIIDTLTERYPNFFYDYSEEHYKMVRFILKENKAEAQKNAKRSK